MTEAEIQALAGALAPVLKAHVAKAAAPILARLDALEARAPVPGPQGEPGPMPSLEAVRAGIAGAVAEQLDAVMGGPIQEKVRSFIADAITPIMPRLQELEARAPVPGPQGEPGAPGRDAPTVEALQEVITRLVAAIPPARDGAAGADGVGLAGALVNREGNLVVTLTDGSHKDLGPVIGRDGKDGAAGRDGFGFDDLSAALADDGRTLVLAFTRGDIVKEFHLALAHPIDRGVWKPGTYQRGDAVTWGGSMWIAQEETTSEPETDKTWRLAVKRGRDGRDGVMKAPKVQGPVKVGI